MSGQRGCLRGDAFHQVAVADDRIGGVVDDLETGTVVTRRHLRFANRHAHRIGKPLPQRAGGGLYAWRMPPFGMPRCLAAPLAEIPDVVQRQVVTGEMQQAVEQHRTVPGREYEAVTVEPARITRIVPEQ